MIDATMRSVAKKSIEIENGIIWSIDSTLHQCGVKILGSSNVLTIDYPQSWSIAPSWVQLGAPVQMRYGYGLKNALEIIGPGYVIPTPATGDYNPSQEATLLSDIIMSGCEVVEIPLEPQMGVLVRTGEIRIDGSTIEVGAIKMDSTYYKMDMGGRMGNVAAAIELNTAPTDTDNCRYDMFVSGTDGIVDLVTGTTFNVTAATASVPTVPADHIELDRVLITPGKTIVRNCDVGRIWEPGRAQALSISVDDTDLSSTQTTAAVTVTIENQYENSFVKGSGLGWRIELEVANGSGSITSTEGTSTSVIGAYAGSSAGYTFTYTREGTAVDISPILTARLISPSIERNCAIILRDSSGDIMTS